ncbi:unnamed protein product [Calypogeia fissa]
MEDSNRLQRMQTIERRSGWWSKDTIAVVTGSNKGVGFETARQLAKHGLTVIVAARHEDRGQNAADTLRSRGYSIYFHQLDVTDDESIRTFVEWVKREFGGINILVNNAGIKKNDVNFENAREVIATNYVSARKVTSAFYPLMRTSAHGARIINLSSQLGALKCLKSEELRKQLSDTEHLSKKAIDSLAAKFLEDVRAGTFKTANWEWSTQNVQYSESKAFLNAYTRVLAQMLAKDGPEEQNVFVNAASPGWTQSDMTRHHEDAQPVEKGADTPVWLALLPREGYPNGKFFANREEVEF